MAYKLVLNDRAEFEMDEAMAWYRFKQEGLEARFLKVVKRHFRMISTNPEAFPYKGYGFRECSVSTFPFVILYKFHQEQVIVYSVFNTHQNPSKKSK